MCERHWTQYLHCNHEHLPMRHTYRCRRVDADARPESCPVFKKVRRKIKYPDMCDDCRDAGVEVDEGYKAGRYG